MKSRFLEIRNINVRLASVILKDLLSCLDTTSLVVMEETFHAMNVTRNSKGRSHSLCTRELLTGERNLLHASIVHTQGSHPFYWVIITGKSTNIIFAILPLKLESLFRMEYSLIIVNCQFAIILTCSILTNFCPALPNISPGYLITKRRL